MNINNSNEFEFGCVLSANGINFEPNIFLKDSVFLEKKILFKGNKEFPEKFKDEMIEEELDLTNFFETTFLIIEISSSEKSSVQIEEAVLFLKQYQHEILRLSKFPNVNYVSINRTLKKDQMAERVTDEFMDLALRCGIKVIM